MPCKDNHNIEFFLTIIQAKDGWFKLKSPIEGMEDNIEIPNGEAWIHGSVISVDTRNYGGQELELLDKADNGKTIGVMHLRLIQNFVMVIPIYKIRPEIVRVLVVLLMEDLLHQNPLIFLLNFQQKNHIFLF